MSRFVIAIDQGTTSTRVSLLNEAGVFVGFAARKVPTMHPRPGWVLQSPYEILDSVLACVRELRSKFPAEMSAAVTVGIANQRETVVAWNAKTGVPLYDAIVWQSKQSDLVCAAVAADGAEAEVKQRSGLPLDPYFSASKMRWMLENVVDIRKAADRGELRFGTVDAWLMWNISGKRVFRTDASNASRTQLLNIARVEWDDELLRIFGVPREALPELCPSSAEVFVTDCAAFEGLSVPVCGVAGDQQAALFGHGCLRPGDAKVTYGTGSFALVNVGDTPLHSAFLGATIAWKLGGAPPVYALEGSALSACSSINWLIEQLGVIQDSSECDVICRSIESTEGCYYVPALGGLGTPYWEPKARAGFVGLSFASTRAHLVRAVVEAMAYQVREIADLMSNDLHSSLNLLRIDGGGSNNDFLAQFQSDLVGLPLRRPDSHEVTSIGAAKLAARAVHLDDFAVSDECSMQVFKPSMPRAEANALYQGWRRAVESCLGLARPGG